jgi:hypothetical protein
VRAVSHYDEQRQQPPVAGARACSTADARRFATRRSRLAPWMRAVSLAQAARSAADGAVHTARSNLRAPRGRQPAQRCTAAATPASAAAVLATRLRRHGVRSTAVAETVVLVNTAQRRSASTASTQCWPEGRRDASHGRHVAPRQQVQAQAQPLATAAHNAGKIRRRPR